MLDPYIEMARGAFILGMVITALFYERFRMVSGGAITGSYLAYLLLIGDYVDVAAWLALTFIGWASIYAVGRVLPLPRKWMFFVGILVPAIVHGTLYSLGAMDVFGGMTMLLTAGLYVTNGLTAYDVVREGWVKVMGAIAAIVTITLAILIPLRLWLENSGYFQLGSDVIPPMFTGHDPVLIIVCILLAAAARLSLGVGSAGIIGTLFLFEIATAESLAIMIAFALIGTLIFRKITPRMALTPRQQMYTIFIVGGIVSWFGLFWATLFGWGGAAIPEGYALEPLIVIPLMILEGTRMGIPKALGGSAMVFLAVAGTSLVTQAETSLQPVYYTAIFAAIAVLFIPGIRELRKGWTAARQAGITYPVMPPTPAK
ncbi:hypothetical protein C8A06_1240 [Microbacteriaceae bacterium MWH-Ta3]|nr:hypothetical protein C8A06_1240 [Microbacteriaceae bacterium MWH-Ta3]